MTISLKPVDRDNFRKCIGLDVYPEQKEFVGSNVVSIAESKVYPHRVPLAVYNDDELVGFVMHGRDPEKFRHWIVRLMNRQGIPGTRFWQSRSIGVDRSNETSGRLR
jgi:diamine N-acetyltransferase